MTCVREQFWDLWHTIISDVKFLHASENTSYIHRENSDVYLGICKYRQEIYASDEHNLVHMVNGD